jgi:hypothetical protein
MSRFGRGPGLMVDVPAARAVSMLLVDVPAASGGVQALSVSGAIYMDNRSL